MDPVTAASTFATIVGLVSSFKAERRASSDDEYRDFLDWLSEKRHNDVVDAINANHSLSSAIEAFLREGHEEVMTKLSALDDSLLRLASHIEGFNEISKAVAPNIELSDQSISILKQLNASGGSFFMELKTLGATMYQVMDASSEIDIAEPRFVDDDLKQLCDLGLLLPDMNSKGERLFRITRASVNYVEQLDSSS